MQLYRRGKVWWCRFTVEGQRYQLTTKEKLKGPAETRANELFRATRDHQPAKEAVPTLRQLAGGRFLDYVNGSLRLSFKSKEYYRYGWLMLSASKLADMRIDRITTEDIDCLNVGGSPSNENCARRTLRRILKLAIAWDLVAKTCRVRLLEEHGREAVVSGDTERLIQEVLGDGALRVAWRIFLDTGLRPKEMAGLLVDDLNFIAGIITVRRPTTKTPSGKRIVPMSARVRSILIEHLAARGEGFVFPSPRYKGKPITAAAMTKAFARARRMAGVPTSTKLYSSRHTYGTDIAKSLKDLPVLMKLMGHADISTTMKYVHPELDEVTQAVDLRNESRKSGTVSATVQ